MCDSLQVTQLGPSVEGCCLLCGTLTDFVAYRKPQLSDKVDCFEQDFGGRRFADRRGDAGRDMTLWLARKLGGLSLRQLAGKIGGISYPEVSSVLRQIARRLVQEKGLAKQVGRSEKGL